MLYKPLPWKLMFPVTSKPTPPTVFYLQAPDWAHCEEETGVYYQLSRHTYKMVIFFHTFLKLFILTKKYVHLKKIRKIYYSFFFQKEIIRHTYICTKCNHNFKFFISLKILTGFCLSAPKRRFIFYNSFFYG